MKFLLITLAIVLILNICAVQGAPSEKGSEDCVYPKLNLTLKRGEEKRPIGKCMRLECFGHGILYAEPCPGKIRDNCIVGPSDLTKEFPHCCPEIKC